MRSLRVYGLFGGKKDKSENADDAPSKVSDLTMSCSLFCTFIHKNALGE